MHYVVSYSGGASSWAAARLTVDRIMTDGDTMTLLFADTLIEDADTYRFLEAGAADIGWPLVRIADGRTPWEVFRDTRFLGNSRVDPCSRILKRELLDRWVDDAAAEGDVTQIIGLDWTEPHRFERFAERLTQPVRAPLIEFGVDKNGVHRMVAEAGLPEQRLYQLGMPHANCGGGCVKAGQSQFRRLYEVLPERFAEWESNEAKLRAELGDVSILKDRTGGTSTPLTLTELRRRIEQEPRLIPAHDWGGCGCAIDDG